MPAAKGKKQAVAAFAQPKPGFGGVSLRGVREGSASGGGRAGGHEQRTKEEFRKAVGYLRAVRKGSGEQKSAGERGQSGAPGLSAGERCKKRVPKEREVINLYSEIFGSD